MFSVKLIVKSFWKIISISNSRIYGNQIENRGYTAVYGVYQQA